MRRTYTDILPDFTKEQADLFYRRTANPFFTETEVSAFQREISRVSTIDKAFSEPGYHRILFKPPAENLFEPGALSLHKQYGLLDLLNKPGSGAGSITEGRKKIFDVFGEMAQKGGHWALDIETTGTGSAHLLDIGFKRLGETGASKVLPASRQGSGLVLTAFSGGEFDYEKLMRFLDNTGGGIKKGELKGPHAQALEELFGGPYSKGNTAARGALSKYWYDPLVDLRGILANVSETHPFAGTGIMDPGRGLKLRQILQYTGMSSPEVLSKLHGTTADIEATRVGLEFVAKFREDPTRLYPYFMAQQRYNATRGFIESSVERILAPKIPASLAGKLPSNLSTTPQHLWTPADWKQVAEQSWKQFQIVRWANMKGGKDATKALLEGMLQKGEYIPAMREMERLTVRGLAAAPGETANLVVTRIPKEIIQNTMAMGSISRVGNVSGAGYGVDLADELFRVATSLSPTAMAQGTIDPNTTNILESFKQSSQIEEIINRSIAQETKYGRAVLEHLNMGYAATEAASTATASQSFMSQMLSRRIHPLWAIGALVGGAWLYNKMSQPSAEDTMIPMKGPSNTDIRVDRSELFAKVYGTSPFATDQYQMKPEYLSMKGNTVPGLSDGPMAISGRQAMGVPFGSPFAGIPAWQPGGSPHWYYGLLGGEPVGQKGRASKFAISDEYLMSYLTGRDMMGDVDEAVTDFGDAVHVGVQQKMLRNRKGVSEYFVNGLDMTGHVDLVLQSMKGNYPIEIKTINSNRFSQMKEPKPAHISQLNYYLNQLKAKRGTLLYIERLQAEGGDETPYATGRVKTFDISYDRERLIADIKRFKKASALAGMNGPMDYNPNYQISNLLAGKLYQPDLTNNITNPLFYGQGGAIRPEELVYEQPDWLSINLSQEKPTSMRGLNQSLIGTLTPADYNIEEMEVRQYENKQKNNKRYRIKSHHPSQYNLNRFETPGAFSIHSERTGHHRWGHGRY